MKRTIIACLVAVFLNGCAHSYSNNANLRINKNGIYTNANININL